MGLTESAAVNYSIQNLLKNVKAVEGSVALILFHNFI